MSTLSHNINYRTAAWLTILYIAIFVLLIKRPGSLEDYGILYFLSILLPFHVWSIFQKLVVVQLNEKWLSIHFYIYISLIFISGITPLGVELILDLERYTVGLIKIIVSFIYALYGIFLGIKLRGIRDDLFQRKNIFIISLVVTNLMAIYICYLFINFLNIYGDTIYIIGDLFEITPIEYYEGEVYAAIFGLTYFIQFQILHRAATFYAPPNEDDLKKKIQHIGKQNIPHDTTRP